MNKLIAPSKVNSYYGCMYMSVRSNYAYTYIMRFALNCDHFI